MSMQVVDNSQKGPLFFFKDAAIQGLDKNTKHSVNLGNCTVSSQSFLFLTLTKEKFRVALICTV